MSAPEPDDEPVRAGASPVTIPERRPASESAVDVPADLPEDIPESVVTEYDANDGWFVPGDDVPIGDGPTDVDPSDFRPDVRRGPAAPAVAPAASQMVAPTIPVAAPNTAPTAAQPAAPDRSERPTAPTRPVPQFGEKQRYGEAVVREILGASFIEERPVAPRQTPGAGREG